ncbi:hypothetical protein CN899_08030 [Bacillus thuringiensis]|uniref:Uncharacterized protein n=1 Tax=Bacillus thuringiensis TaxID=1428 RepID=A0A9X7C2K2_BACTU|nr:hypothetical protein [Bacillus thuringiensis]PGH85779.1 hypothetical protein CN899_08030 [Bacillus thuringiensis]
MKQKHELAQEDYMQGMKYKELAEKYEVSINTIKSWRKRHGWNRKGVHPKGKKGCTPTKKTGAPFGNKNAIGNSGNKNPKWGNKNAVGHGAPVNNKNAVTHGLYAKVVYEHLSDEDRVLFDLSQDIEGQEQELQVARFKLAKLIQEQKNHRLEGVAITSEGSYSYTLKDDFYTDAVNKALDMISKIESRISKAKIEREKLQVQLEKMKAETVFIEERIKLIKGQKKDTGLLDALIEGRKQYEQSSN